MRIFAAKFRNDEVIPKKPEKNEKDEKDHLYETNNNRDRTAGGCVCVCGGLRLVCTAYEARDERDTLALHHGRQREQS